MGPPCLLRRTLLGARCLTLLKANLLQCLALTTNILACLLVTIEGGWCSELVMASINTREDHGKESKKKEDHAEKRIPSNLKIIGRWRMGHSCTTQSGTRRGNRCAQKICIDLIISIQEISSRQKNEIPLYWFKEPMSSRL